MAAKWIQINKIQGYEEVKDQYWISNSDEDKIINRNTGKILRGYIDKYGYRRANLRTTCEKLKSCKFHVIKAKAFLFTPNPLGANMVRHLNDIRTDNRLENLAWGTRSDNTFDSIRNGSYNYEAAAKGGAKGGATMAKKISSSVKCLETGITYTSACEAERQTRIANGGINACCRGKQQTAGGFHWTYVNKND